MLSALISFPFTICAGVIWVVSMSSKVWRSRSPLMLEAVTAGTIKVSRINSMVATNSYISIKLLYWMVAVALTWETTEYIFISATAQRMPLNTVRISGRRRLRELTLDSRL